MNKMVNLDVLVVYSAEVAQSASVNDAHSRYPFLTDSKQSNYNLSYEYFLNECQRHGIEAGFTSSTDVIGPGTCQNYWTSHQGNWIKVDSKAQSKNVFIKLSPSSEERSQERELLLSHESIIPFNDKKLFTLFFDKLETYKTLPKYALPTVNMPSSNLKSIKRKIKLLDSLIAAHPHSDDFSDEYVLKDRFGAGGNYVYKIAKNDVSNINSIMVSNPTISFVIQPFLLFDKGFTFRNSTTATDIRMIYHHNELLQSYVRIAQEDDFLCNEHQGGQLIYCNEDEIPQRIHAVSQKVMYTINKPNSLFALDFLVSNKGRVYFLEGNIGPGLDWDINKKVNEQKSKQLIRSIVKEFSNRINS